MADNSDKLITVKVNENSSVSTTRAVYQYDHGQSLKVIGATNGQANHVCFYFASGGPGVYTTATSQLGLSVQTDIPDPLLLRGENIFADFYYETEDRSIGYTVAVIKIPVIERPNSKRNPVK